MRKLACAKSPAFSGTFRLAYGSASDGKYAYGVINIFYIRKTVFAAVFPVKGPAYFFGAFYCERMGTEIAELGR